jgi:hypothetical protein
MSSSLPGQVEVSTRRRKGGRSSFGRLVLKTSRVPFFPPDSQMAAHVLFGLAAWSWPEAKPLPATCLRRAPIPMVHHVVFNLAALPRGP